MDRVHIYFMAIGKKSTAPNPYSNPYTVSIKSDLVTVITPDIIGDHIDVKIECDGSPARGYISGTILGRRTDETQGSVVVWHYQLPPLVIGCGRYSLYYAGSTDKGSVRFSGL